MPSAEQMKVQVVHRLATIVTRIDDDAIAFGKTVRTRDVRGHRDKMAEECTMFRCDLRQRSKVLFRNDQHMRRSLRVDVRERDALLIFVEALYGNRPGDDLAEEAV